MILLYAGVAALYAVALWLRGPGASPRVRPALVIALVVLALVVHAVTIVRAVFTADGLDLSFPQALSLVAWLTVLVSLLSGLLGKLPAVGNVILPVAALCALAPLAGGAPHRVAYGADTWGAVHIAVALIGYALVTVAALQALLLTGLEKRLHSGTARPESDGTMPLLSLERFLFQLVAAGFVLLTLTIASGLVFSEELFGIDETLERVQDYFKAASAGSEVGRRLLLLLGPPSGGKSSMVILLKRGLEAYSHTDAGALYGIHGCPVHESPLHLIPHTMRGQFRSTYGVEVSGELCPHCTMRVQSEFGGDFMQMPVQRIFISEAGRVGVGTYAPHDPTTADIADLVGSVDLSKVAKVGDEGDPRAWSWSGAVYAASRGMLEMIEILKVKREFLYLLLTLTQEKNVKVSRFPLIHLDETIVAHTNLAEFNKFLQEKENEALLDRMVIVKVPYTLSFRDEARIYRKLVSSAPAFARCISIPTCSTWRPCFRSSQDCRSPSARVSILRRSSSFTPRRTWRASRQRTCRASRRSRPTRVSRA